MAGAKWQLDLIDAKNMGAEAGYAMVAVDVVSRKIYGTLLNGKTTADIIAAFDRIIGPQVDDSRASLDVNVPSTISLDQERGWKTPAFLNHLQKYNITLRFKTDKFQPNSLGSVDNAIKRIKQYNG